MVEIKLREYQWQAVRFTVDELQNGASAVAVVAPTGAGKTTIITSILHKMPGLRSAFVAAPQKSIERGFLTDATFIAPAPHVAGSVSAPIIGRGSQYVPLRDERDKDDKAQTLLAGVRPGVDKWGLTTHSQLCNWGAEFFPDNLTGHLLVIDEAHHAGSSDDAKRIVTRLAVIADTYRERGGMVLYVTATPYRSDGERVLPEGTDPWTWTIADHAASGFAPANFHIRTVSSGIEVSTPAEYAGDALPTQEEDGGDGYRMMVDRWIEDGRPKSVFIVPARDSVGWATRLERALVDAGAPKERVCNAVGTDAAADARFSNALNAERAAESFEKSSTDVFIACKRFDEGTDWPLCSHVYNWGVPASFGLIIQRWGRTFRDKSRYPDYPDAVRQVAQLTFFVPKVAEDARDQFSNHHHEHAWLLGTYLADWETGREYRAAMRLRFERAWSRRTTSVAPAAEVNDIRALFGDLLDDGPDDDLDRVRLSQAATLPDHVRVKALALIGQVEIAIGGEPTVRNIVNHIETLGVDPEMMAAVREVIAERVAGVDAGAGDLVDRGLDRIVSSRSPLKEVVRRELADLYRSVIDQFGDRTVPIAGAAMAYTTQFTGDDAKVIADRLREALEKPDFTVEGLERAIRAYHAEHGKAPIQTSGDASPYLGWSQPEQWVHISACIRNGSRGLEALKAFGGLHGFCIHLGLKEPDLENPNFTVDLLERAVRAFYDKYGKAPSVKSGNASPYLEWFHPESWRNVNACISNGSRGLESIKKFGGLHGYCIHLKLKEPDLENPDFTVDQVERAIRAFHAEHGKAPSAVRHDASKYLGWTLPERWDNVDACIKTGRRGLKALKAFGSLSKYCAHLLKLKNPDFTVDQVERAIRAFYAGHGKVPSAVSGDASKYLGWTLPEQWRNVDECIRNGSRGLESIKEFGGLSKYCVHLKLKNPDFTVEQVERAIKAFHAERGEAPIQTSGDASPYLGWPDGAGRWDNVNACIKTGRRGLEALKAFGGLHGFCIHLGLKDNKPDFTVDLLERAIRAFYAGHGKVPSAVSGDASKYLGWPDGTESWKNINQCIRNGSRGLESIKKFGGLHGYCIHLGLKSENPDFTVDQVDRAIKAFHAEHGKAPVHKSGDASKYLGGPQPEQWDNVSQCIRTGRRGLESIKEFGGLHGYCIHLKLKNPDFTVEQVERAAKAFHAERGEAPIQTSGDASPYLGWPDGAERWSNVNACIKTGRRGLEALKGSSLSHFCQALGLK